MKKRIAGFMAGVTLAVCLPLTAQAAQAVNVTLPAFTVTLNGIEADSVQSQYPFLVYKDITYVPMTYHDARLLGLETKWTAKEGLVINKASEFDAKAAAGAYKPYTAGSKNGSTYQATIVEGAVTVQGKAIDNSKEEYPLLLFREVTYFPLTWRFAHDTFGWQYTFDNKNGLKITPVSVSASGGASAGKLTVTGNVVNVRAANNTDSEVVDQVTSGTTLSYLAKKDDWYQVALPSGKTGWIAGWLVTETASSNSSTGPQPSTKPNTNTNSSSAAPAVGKISITGNVVNVRAANNTDSEVVAKVNSGEVLTYTKKQDNWYQVTLPGGQSGWVAGWLATDITSTAGGSSAGSSTVTSGGTLDIDSTHALKMAQSGSGSVLTLTGISSASDYKLTKNSDSSLTVRVNKGNFKPQSYTVGKYGIKSVAITGQLMTIQFSSDVTYTAKLQNNSELVLTVQPTGSSSSSSSSGSSGSSGPSGSEIPVVANAFKVNHMAPGEAKTITELSVGMGNAVQVTSATATQIILSIDNNTLGTFAPINNSIGPLAALSARSAGGNKVEVTLTLKNGAYCVLEQINGNLLITTRSRNWSASQGLAGKTIVLDPGHGGSDPGAIGMVLGVSDAEVGLNVCNALKPMLEAAGAKVIMTRSDANGFLSVGERAQLSNSVNADLFVSVHANSAKPNTQPYGTQVYYYAPSNDLTLAAQKPIRVELARAVSDNIKGQTGRKSDIYTKNLGVLRENDSPCILVETGFLSNAEEEALLADPNYINKMATGIYQGIVQYYNVH